MKITVAHYVPSNEPGITLKTLLQHLQQMGSTLQEQIRGVKDDLRETKEVLVGESRGVEERLAQRIDRVERTLTQQIDAIDRRLDELEIERLPRRVKTLEQAVFGVDGRSR